MAAFKRRKKDFHYYSGPRNTGSVATEPAGSRAVVVGARVSEYDAFISYSHSKDIALANALQSALQRFNKPWYRRRALRIFRDETSLAAAPGLWPAIRDNLTASRFLILIASPESAGSEWVAREVQHWIDLGRTEKLLVVLSAGKTVSSVLPRTVQHAFPYEPFHIDLSWARCEEKVSPRDIRLALPIARLAAPIHGRQVDDLIGDDRRQHRRTRRLIKQVIATLTVLLLIAVGATVRAVQQQQIAQQQRDLAELAARQATARLLANEATGADPNDMDIGLLLAAQSYAAEPDSSVSWGALVQAITRDPYLIGYLPGITRPTAVATASTGDLVVVGAFDGTVTLWQAATKTRIEPTPPPLHGAVRAVGFSADGLRLVAADDAGNYEMWDLPSSSVVDNGNVGASAIAAALDATGQRFVIGTSDYARYGGPGLTPRTLASIFLSSFRFGPDDTLTAGTGQGGLESWQLSTGEQLTDDQIGWGQPVASAFTADLTKFAGVTVGNQPYVLDTSDRSSGENIDIGQTGLSIQDLVFDPTGSTLAAIGPTGITLLDVAAAHPMPAKPTGIPGDFQAAALEAGGRVIVVAGDRGVAVWNLDAQTDLIHPLPTTGLLPRDQVPNVIRGAVSATFSHNRKFFAWTGSEEGWELVVVVRDLQTNREIARVPSMGVESFSPNDDQLAVRAPQGASENSLQVITLADGQSQPVADVPWKDAATPQDTPKNKPWTVDNGHGLGAAIPADGILQLWDVNRGQPIGQLSIPAQPDAASLTFDGTGQRLALTAAGGYAYLVDVDPDSWWRLACRLAGRTLTADERANYLGRTALPPECP